MTKFQVFVSSTYLDLKDERQAAVEAILLSNNIPAGMELFSAGNESQLEIIKEWIDDSDIYMLILGGRYGSLEPQSQLSYTEIEYRYAIEIGKPVFALVMNEQALDKKIRKGGKQFLELENRDKYDKFKADVLTKICKTFSNLTEIKLETTNSLRKIINSDKYQLKGWIKNDPAVIRQIKNHLPADVFSYGIKITSPKFGDVLPNPVLVSGIFEKEPPKGLFYCIELNPQLGTYWPKTEISFDIQTKEWQSVMGMGQGDDKDRVMLIVAVGKYGEEIINDFYLTPMHRGLAELSNDMIVVDRVRITLKKEGE